MYPLKSLNVPLGVHVAQFVNLNYNYKKFLLDLKCFFLLFLGQRCLESRNAPNNGRKSANEKGYYEFEDVISFNCFPGYNLIGENSTTCQSDGTWSAPTPTCQSSYDLS